MAVLALDFVIAGGIDSVAKIAGAPNFADLVEAQVAAGAELQYSASD